MKLQQLTIEQVIKILSKNEILFTARILDSGQDTNWDEISFEIDDEKYSDFDFYLDLDTHGCNICSETDRWLFKVTNEDELFKVIDISREKHTDPISPKKKNKKGTYKQTHP